MSVVEHMVCPACSERHGREHLADCPWNGMSGGVRPWPGVSEAYRAAAIEKLLEKSPHAETPEEAAARRRAGTWLGSELEAELRKQTRACASARWLDEYEINAATTALADCNRINPRTDQQNAADRAYYKLLDLRAAQR